MTRDAVIPEPARRPYICTYTRSDFEGNKREVHSLQVASTAHGAASSLAKTGLLEQGAQITVTVSTEERPVFEVNSRFESLVCRLVRVEPRAEIVKVTVQFENPVQQSLFSGGSR